MLNGIQPKTAPLSGISKILKGADVAIVNLEIPLCTIGKPTNRKTPAELKAKSQFILKGSPQHIPGLRKVGIDAVTLASNHTMDYGSSALTEMTRYLQKHKIAFAGAGTDESAAARPAFIETGQSPKVAILAALSFLGHKANWKATPATDGPGVMALQFGGVVGAQQRERLRKWLGPAKQKGGFVIAALHSGLEKKTLPTPYQVALARACIDEGADLVVGHHPHVLQGAEIYKGKPILYSVGNLISPRPGKTAIFHLRYNGKKLQRFAITPCKIAGSKVAPMRSAEAKALAAHFDQLSAKVAKTYPNPSATPLKAKAEFASTR